MVLFPGCRCCGGCGSCCGVGDDGLHLMANGLAAGQETFTWTGPMESNLFTLGPGRWADMEMIDAPTGRRTLRKVSGVAGNPIAPETKITLHLAGGLGECTPPVTQWMDESTYVPGSGLAFRGGVVGGDASRGRFIEIIRDVISVSVVVPHPVGFIKSVSFGGVTVAPAKMYTVFTPEYYIPAVDSNPADDSVIRIKNSDWSGPLAVTATITHDLYGNPITPVDYSYELDIPTLFQLPGCEECGGGGGGVGACASGCRDHYISVLDNVITAENWESAFHVEFGNINTDTPPNFGGYTNALAWRYTHADGSPDQVLFRVYSRTHSYEYVLHVGRLQSGGVTHGLTINLSCDGDAAASVLSVSTRTADEITHTALDGTVTVWPRTGTENAQNTPISITVPHGQDSPFFTGTYFIDGTPWGSFEPIAPILIELPAGDCQIFRRIHGDCTDPPACEPKGGVPDGNPLP